MAMTKITRTGGRVYVRDRNGRFARRGTGLGGGGSAPSLDVWKRRAREKNVLAYQGYRAQIADAKKRKPTTRFGKKIRRRRVRAERRAKLRAALTSFRRRR